MWIVVFVSSLFDKDAAYSMATHLMIDKGDTSATARKESKHIMTQDYGRFFKFIISYFLWFMLAIISAGIALIWIAPKFAVGKSLFYSCVKI